MYKCARNLCNRKENRRDSVKCWTFFIEIVNKKQLFYCFSPICVLLSFEILWRKSLWSKESVDELMWIKNRQQSVLRNKVFIENINKTAETERKSKIHICKLVIRLRSDRNCVSAHESSINSERKNERKVRELSAFRTKSNRVARAKWNILLEKQSFWPHSISNRCRVKQFYRECVWTKKKERVFLVFVFLFCFWTFSQK